MCTPCPAGTYQSARNATQCEPCQAGSYCPKGVAFPLPCTDGTFSDAIGLASPLDCAPCPDGFWCNTGKRYPCGVGLYTNGSALASERTSLSACLACPPHSSTAGSNTSSPSGCLCDAGYYDRSTTRSTSALPRLPTCRPCPDGTLCSNQGTALETLFLKPGYWRVASSSAEIVPCPDITAGCSSTDWACEESTSGCSGGDTSSSSACRPGLEGPYCLLCANASAAGVFYAAATASQPAHCEPCVHTAAGSWGIIIAILAAIAILIYLVYRRLDALLERPFAARLVRSYRRLRRASRHYTKRYGVMSKFKSTYGFYQIATQVEAVYAVMMPASIHAMLSTMELAITFGLNAIDIPLQCAGTQGYMGRLVFWFVTPLVAGLIIVIVAGCSQGDENDLAHSERYSDGQSSARCAAANSQQLDDNDCETRGAALTGESQRVATALSARPSSASAAEWTPPSSAGGPTGLARRLEHENDRMLARANLSSGRSFASTKSLATFWGAWSDRQTFRRRLLAYLPLVLRLFFVAYPLVANVAFQAFSCEGFDDGVRRLRADYSIECSWQSRQYVSVVSLSIASLLLYPVGVPAFYLALLFTNRRSIVARERTPMTAALWFLYHEYQPHAYLWELAEMLRRFVLVGVAVLIVPGSITQLAFASTYCLAHLIVQVQVNPYKMQSSNFVAVSCSFFLVALFLSVTFLKLGTITENEALVSRLSTVELYKFRVPTELLQFTLGVGVMGTVFLTAGVLMWQAWRGSASASASPRLDSDSVGDHDRDAGGGGDAVLFDKASAPRDDEGGAEMAQTEDVATSNERSDSVRLSRVAHVAAPSKRGSCRRASGAQVQPTEFVSHKL